METDQQIIHDLKLSGLTKDDINAREIELNERAACSLPASVEGYVIPYYTLLGKPLPFYRTKLFGHVIKYKQLKNTSNHIYFPPNLYEALKATKFKYLILTEGEKKAASAVKNGFPAAAFGGVDSWRNRMLLLPKDTEFGAYSYNKQLVGAKLPTTTLATEGVTLEPIAVGFVEMVSLALRYGTKFIVIYDTDDTGTLNGLKYEVQKAAAELGFELRQRGIPIENIRQIVLPLFEDLDKVGLDDYLTLLKDGPEQLQTLITKTLKKRSAFPIHPNIQANISKQLEAPKLSRTDLQKLSLSIVTDLDSKGIRMHSSKADQLFYFETKSSKLVKVDLGAGAERGQNSAFSKLLYQNYGISTSADTRLVKWLNTQFAGEDPVEDVDPFRVLARREVLDDCVRYQISDGRYVNITGDKDDPITVHYNGTQNILFESEQVEPIEEEELLKEFKKRQEEPIKLWWGDVLADCRLKDGGKSAQLIALLYYISPWLHRWRGTQLPAELVIGEAGTGKSTLCELRLNILTGSANLRNAPTDIKDWHASIANSGGLHVTDNVNLLDKNLKQRLSDEICRLVTEPDPHVEMRKLYSNADLMRVKVDAVFCFTAILQPFMSADLLQRSIKIELDKTASNPDTKISYDSTWKQKQEDRFGGRTAWISHHLYVLHKFFERVEKEWDNDYQAQHRLINLEQILVMMAKVFGIDHKWIPEFLSQATDDSIVSADWTLEGIMSFVRAVNDDQTGVEQLLRFSKKNEDRYYAAKQVAQWCCSQDDYMDCTNLTNARRLGRYLQTHKSMLARVAGFHEIGKICNLTTYQVRMLPKTKKD